MYIRIHSQQSSIRKEHKPKLLDQVRIHLRSLHYSPSTQDSCVNWIERYVIFHNKTHPEKLGKDDIRTVQELPGHKDFCVTMVYTHIINNLGMGVKSPLDF